MRQYSKSPKLIPRDTPTPVKLHTLSFHSLSNEYHLSKNKVFGWTLPIQTTTLILDVDMTHSRLRFPSHILKSPNVIKVWSIYFM